MDHLISIIIPVYNIEKYIENCVKSVTEQTYKNIEIILVDDGATDNSGDLCDKLSQADNRIVVIHKKNGGLSSARNSGIEKAHGEFFMFIDGDDFIDTDMVQKLYDAIIKNNCDMAVCSVNNIDEAGNPVDVLNNDNPIFDEIIEKEDYFRKMLGTGYWYWVVAWNKLYRKTLFDKERYSVGKLHEDEFIIHKLVNSCKKIVCISDKLYNYIQRGGSITNKKYSVKRLDVIEAFEKRQEFYLENNVSEDIIINNIKWTVSTLYESFGKSERTQEYKNRYKELEHKLKILIKKTFRCKMTAVTRVYLVLNYISPYCVWKIIKKIGR